MIRELTRTLRLRLTRVRTGFPLPVYLAPKPIRMFRMRTSPAAGHHAQAAASHETSALRAPPPPRPQGRHIREGAGIKPAPPLGSIFYAADMPAAAYLPDTALLMSAAMRAAALHPVHPPQRSEEHTSELQSQ